MQHHRTRVFWRQLDATEKSQFTNLFKETFKHQLRDYSAGNSEQAYAQGHGDGWDYGLLIAREWGFRQGYHEGYESALIAHAEAVLDDGYATVTQPEIREVVRDDVRNDVAFEPGEEVLGGR